MPADGLIQPIGVHEHMAHSGRARLSGSGFRRLHDPVRLAYHMGIDIKYGDEFIAEHIESAVLSSNE